MTRTPTEAPAPAGIQAPSAQQRWLPRPGDTRGLALPSRRPAVAQSPPADRPDGTAPARPTPAVRVLPRSPTPPEYSTPARCSTLPSRLPAGPVPPPGQDPTPTRSRWWSDRPQPPPAPSTPGPRPRSTASHFRSYAGDVPSIRAASPILTNLRFMAIHQRT